MRRISDIRNGPEMDPKDKNAPFSDLNIKIKQQIVADKLTDSFKHVNLYHLDD